MCLILTRICFRWKFRNENTSSREKRSKETNVRISGSCILCEDNFRMIARRSTVRSFARSFAPPSSSLSSFHLAGVVVAHLLLFLIYFIRMLTRNAWESKRNEMTASVDYISWDAKQLSCGRRFATFVIFGSVSRVSVAHKIAICTVSARPYDLHDSRKIANNIIFKSFTVHTENTNRTRFLKRNGDQEKLFLIPFFFCSK